MKRFLCPGVINTKVGQVPAGVGAAMGLEKDQRRVFLIKVGGTSMNKGSVA